MEVISSYHLLEIQFHPVCTFGRPGMPGRWWILRRCSTTNTRTKDAMRRRSCDTPVAPALIVKPATVTVKSTALITALCPRRARKRSMRWESQRIKPSSHPSTLVSSSPSTPSPTLVRIIITTLSASLPIQCFSPLKQHTLYRELVCELVYYTTELNMQIFHQEA